MVTSFLKYLQSEKRFSEHTVTAYKNDLTQFCSYLEDYYELSDLQKVTDKMVRSWMVELSDIGISARSINRKLSTLKSLYRFSISKGWGKVNPLVNITGPKQEKRLLEFIDEKEMKKLFSTIEFEDTFKGLRDKMILDLFYQTGMRSAELRGLKVLDIDFSKKVLKVLGKRNKERLIPLHGEMLRNLKSYINKRDDVALPGVKALIIDNKGNICNEKFVYRKVNSYLSAVTLTTKRSPHIIRHTFATHMLNRGADLNTIKEILGHASLAATQVYTHNSIDKLKEIYKQAHPKGQK
jgi:integrase/recombinase XerC